ncbi:hypothetical protein [Rhizobacter sp. P5_C2]
MKASHTGPDTAQRGTAAEPGEREPIRPPAGAVATRYGSFQAGIDRSPRLLAQRRALQAAFGSSFQSRTGVIQGAFKDSAELRKEAFIAKAQTYLVETEAATELYGRSGGDDLDPVTHLMISTDKDASRKLARDYVGSDGHTDKVFYATIKFRNLAGLNAAKGHAGADAIFGRMADCVRQSLAALRIKYQVRGYRHEGSQFGFMIVGAGETIKAETELALKGAELAWGEVKKERDLAGIANPKAPSRPGVDLAFKVDEMDARPARRDDADTGERDQAREPADVGIGPRGGHESQGAAPGIFKGQALARRDSFFELADRLKLDEVQAADLYQIAGRSEKEPLTGFDAAGDRLGTVEKARLFVREKPDVYAAYVEVDVRNLGGLNDNLTRGDSDNVFRFMSDTADKHVRSLKADVVSFRHGGDEFSFVVVAKIGDVQAGAVRQVLGEAQAAVDVHVQDKKIRQKERKDFSVAADTGHEVAELNSLRLPTIFVKPLEGEVAMRSKPKVEISEKNVRWRVIGSETYWLISKEDATFNVMNIPRLLTLSQILHSKDSIEKPRLPGTGIVWGTSSVLSTDESPVDVIARADQEVELKKL